jgi:sec-independent protein translocase protein TatC
VRVRRAEPAQPIELTGHLDELRSRLIIILGVLGLGVSLCFWRSGEILAFLQGPLPDGRETKFLATNPLDPLMTSISISIYGGLLLAVPVASYQLYAFLIPAVDEQHHRSLRPLVAMVPALFIAGAAFGWYLVVPPSLDFLLGFNDDQFQTVLRAKDYIQYVALTLLAMGLVFELPVVMMILARLKVVSSTMMRRHWRTSIVGLATVAMLLPGVDPISFVVEFLPLLGLYAVSYAVVVTVERRARPSTAAGTGFSAG